MSKENFLGKQNITKLYKNILNNNNLSGLSKDEKQSIVNSLMRNMKKVFKSIDLSRINPFSSKLVGIPRSRANNFPTKVVSVELINSA